MPRMANWLVFLFLFLTFFSNESDANEANEVDEINAENEDNATMQPDEIHGEVIRRSNKRDGDAGDMESETNDEQVNRKNNDFDDSEDSDDMLEAKGVFRPSDESIDAVGDHIKLGSAPPSDDSKDSIKDVGAQSESKIDTSFYVSILYKSSVICAGSLVTPDMVVTSTRCFIARDRTKEFKSKHLTVRSSKAIGRRHYKPANRVRTLYTPSGALNGVAQHKLAMLKMKTSFKSRTAKPIPLCRGSPRDKDKVKLLFIDTQNYKLETYRTTVISKERCKQLYDENEQRDTAVSEDHTFCVKNKKSVRKYACNTRVGDPLLFNNKLCGVNLYGEHCLVGDNELAADVFVDVNRLKTFVRTHSTSIKTSVS